MTDGRWQRKLAVRIRVSEEVTYALMRKSQGGRYGTVPIWNKAQWTPLIYHGNAARTSGPRERRARRH